MHWYFKNIKQTEVVRRADENAYIYRAFFDEGLNLKESALGGIGSNICYF